MKLIEVTDSQQGEPEKLECPNCGGELEHRTLKYNGYIESKTGYRESLYLPVDDYVCKQCKKVYMEEEE